ENSQKISRTIDEVKYQLSAESFFQTNIELLPQLIDEAIGNSSGETAIELYSGVGLFTVPLARKFARVIAVEDNEDAAQFARENVANAGLANVQVEASDVARWFERIFERDSM